MIQARNRRRIPLVMPATVHIRRSYAECRYGQLHVATAYPSGGGFDERTPLICLHPSAASARVFAPLLPELGRDRSVYAPDLPGHGHSDPGPATLTASDFAAAIADFIDSLRLRTVDVMGIQLGALTAAELAIAKPQQVRRLVLASVPYFTAQERSQQVARTAPAVASADGSHLLKEWSRLVEARGTNVAPDVLTDQLADVLRSGRQGSAAASAALEYSASQRLALVRQPVLLLRTHDELWEQTLRAKALFSHGSLAELPDAGFSAATQKVAQLTREFLDR